MTKMTWRERVQLFWRTVCPHKWDYKGDAGALRVYYCERCGVYVKLRPHQKPQTSKTPKGRTA